MAASKGPGPWHLVNRYTGKHTRPFTTQLDCLMALSIADINWRDAMVLSLEAFETHLKNPQAVFTAEEI